MKKQDELELLDEGVSDTTVEQAKRILKLMQGGTSLSVVSEFLKRKELYFSAGSWEELAEKRIIPSLRSRAITLAELNGLLAEVEEFGRFHVFLYLASRHQAERCIDRKQIERTCEKLETSRALHEVIVEELPETPTLTQIREEASDGHPSWVFKIIEKREEKTFLGATTTGDRFRKEWLIGFARAVNVAKLHASGLLELRIQSHVSSTRYEDDLDRIWKMLGEFLPRGSFDEFSLSKAKNKFWGNREALKRKIRFSDSTMRNQLGSTIIASTGAEAADLLQDTSIGPSLDQFFKQGGYCDASNIWFRPREGTVEREIHVLISGRNNEFAVTASCARKEYEYVLSELCTNNR